MRMPFVLKADHIELYLSKEGDFVRAGLTPNIEDAVRFKDANEAGQAYTVRKRGWLEEKGESPAFLRPIELID